MKAKRIGVLWVGVLAVATGCARGGGSDRGGGDVPSAALPACEALDGILPHAFDVPGLTGRYTLRVYATRGDSAGKDVSGQLTLLAHADSLREAPPRPGSSSTVVTPLYGTADIDVGAVGAAYQGDLASTDPMKPGVVGIERHVDRGVEVTLRFGSIANTRGIAPFDGAYTAFSAKWGTADRFGGTWGSGVMQQSSGGYFCADRIPASD